MTQDNYCIGMDFGTDSLRMLIVDAANGTTMAEAVCDYTIWKEGRYCNAAVNQFRQHPLDHIEAMEKAMRRCLHEAGPAVRKNIRAISAATTGSTPVAVNWSGQPLSLLTPFMKTPDAMFLLWKDHSAANEAEEINARARQSPVDYLRYVGGTYSSEWYWAKFLHILRQDERLRPHCAGLVEHADWIPFLLTGGKSLKDLRRSICTAGHKALWAEEWGGFPPNEFFSGIDPLLGGYAATLSKHVYTADQRAGRLSFDWAARFGLDSNVVVGIGAMDAHMGAVGAQIEPYHLSKVMGTSTCDMLVAPTADLAGRTIKGICGQVNGSIIPGMIGMEAGQSAFGDIYAWLRDTLAWPLRELLPSIPDRDRTIGEITDKIIPALSARAAQLPMECNAELAIDWFNGRRSPGANPWLRGALTGLNLGSTAPSIFRSLVESTCFGARAIIETFRHQEVPVKGLIGTGGISRKSPYIMQTLADILGMPIRINRCEQCGALGAAMFAATAAGLYPKVEEAMAAMGQGFDQTHYPDPGRGEQYEHRYRKYLSAGAFLELQTNH